MDQVGRGLVYFQQEKQAACLYPCTQSLIPSDLRLSLPAPPPSKDSTVHALWQLPSNIYTLLLKEKKTGMLPHKGLMGIVQMLAE